MPWERDVVLLEMLNQIKERLSIFNNLYDNLRIIDPIKKKVILLEKDKFTGTEEACYGFWNRNELCVNCVSMRAHIQNDTFVKLECRNENVYLIIATPVDYGEERYILELIKDITDNRNYTNQDSENKVKMLVGEMNNTLIKDDLTKLYNSKYISERLPADIEKVLLEGCSLSIILADIDEFGKINALYGKETGDKILKDFAKLLLSVAGDTECWIARYGGDGFILVINDNDQPYMLADNIRQLVENASFVYENVIIKITSSFGVYTIEDYDTGAETILNKVESNLLRAKLAGRNIVIK